MILQMTILENCGWNDRALAKIGKLKRENESLFVAVQNETVRTNYVDKKIDNKAKE